MVTFNNKYGLMKDLDPYLKKKKKKTTSSGGSLPMSTLATPTEGAVPKTKPKETVKTETSKPETGRKETGAPLNMGDRLELAQARARNAGIPETSSRFPMAHPELGGIITSSEEMEAEKAREEEGTAAPIPGGRELVEPTVGKFTEVDVGPKNAGISLLARTPLGQALIGKIALDQLKKQGKADLIVDMTNEMIKNGLTPQQVTNDPGTQMLLSLELDEKDIELLNSGRVDVGALSQIVEGIPGVGKLAKTIGGGIIPTVPAKRLEELEKKIEKMGNKVRDYRMAAARTPANKDAYLELIEKQEEEIRDAESRIKLLAIQSPLYQNSPEEIEVVFEVIDRSLNRIGDAKNAVLMGETLEEAMNSQLIE